MGMDVKKKIILNQNPFQQKKYRDKSKLQRIRWLGS